MSMSGYQKILIRDFSILIFISFSIFWQCGGKSDSETKTESEISPRHHYELNWNANSEADVSHYLLYASHGEDTLFCTFH